MTIRKHANWIAVALLIGAYVGPISAFAFGPPAGPEWKLAWSDEFDGAQIDRAKWDFAIGNGFYNVDAKAWVPGWGNNELEYYTDEAENAFVREGMLHIRAIKKPYKDFAYTSARLTTAKKDRGALFSKTYGRFEFRAKLPVGKGIWPALWMLPQTEAYGPWPCSGEIDVMEARGHEPNKVVGTTHFGTRWPAYAHASKDYVLPNGGSIADFHVYAIEWEPGEIRWYVDGRISATQSSWWSRSRTDGAKGQGGGGEDKLNAWPAPFDQPFYLVMNVAVGGNFLGNPDETTRFPVEMVVDYVRVFDKVGGYGKVKPRGVGQEPSGGK